MVSAALLLAAIIPVNPARAENPLNGTAPRPFYIFAHNPNTLPDVYRALVAGANALEPDITQGYVLAFDGTILGPCDDPDLLRNLVDHDSSAPYGPGSCDDTKLEDWLDGVHGLAIQFPQLALVVFDIKPSAVSSDNGLLILDAIRTHLNGHGFGAYWTDQEVHLNVIISVAHTSDGAIFDYIAGTNAIVQLRDREGVQVDGEDDAGAVVNYFYGRGYTGNIGFGDGTAGPGPLLHVIMDGAAGLRAGFGYPKALTYVYTINLDNSMQSFIDGGVDGIITDDVDDLYAIVRGRHDIRLATRDDNPFQSPREAYALRIGTADDDSGEGTDANLTFTLQGDLGSATITVNTDPTGRMESGDENWVTLVSKNLGVLRSITVNNDGAHDGIDTSDWKLQYITVYSARWLKPDVSYNYSVVFDNWIDGGTSRTLPLTPHFPAPQARTDEYAWRATDWGYLDGTSRAPWGHFADAYNWVSPGGTIHVAAGRYDEKLTLTKPCTLTSWPDHGPDPAVIGSP